VPASANKAAQLERIAEEIRQLEESPLYAYRKEHGYLPVVGEGDPDARLMFIGEAPGKQEAASGRPFVGRAGGVLDGLLESIGIDRQDLYITNVVKDRPPDNRDPHVEEIELYAPFLMRQIDIIEPEAIATLGRFAMDFVLNRYDLPQQGRRISDLHGEVLKAEASYGKVAIVPLYHPAATFYSHGLEEIMQKDFQVLKRLCHECQA
jgi:uracil-DNA glycosylase family 4